AAQTLESTVTELRREDVPVDQLTDSHFEELFELLADGELAKEGVPDLLTAVAEHPELSVAEAAEQEGLGSAGEDEAIVEVVERNEGQVEAEGMGAFSALMGECMGALRGKADGDVVSDVLREEIQKRA
ncbi:MAG: Glu-tRNA(Gln) amidotransferase GatDE subunit E, partial [Halovenus sp.]